MMTLRDLEGCRIVRAAIVGDSPTLTLDNGATVIAQRDEEGNGPGHLEIDFDGTACGRDEEAAHTVEHHSGSRRSDTTKHSQEVLASYREENKRLKALNAELLEALRACESYLADVCDFGVLDRHPAGTSWNLARAAITKATGGEP